MTVNTGNTCNWGASFAPETTLLTPFQLPTKPKRLLTQAMLYAGDWGTSFAAETAPLNTSPAVNKVNTVNTTATTGGGGDWSASLAPRTTPILSTSLYLCQSTQALLVLLVVVVTGVHL